MSKIFNIQSIITENKPGKLSIVDIDEICRINNIKFKPNRIFYLNDLNSTKSRGKHSNKNASEILICLSGSFEIKLNDSINEKIYTIEKDNGIYIPKNIWLDFYNFKNCIILVFVDIDYSIEKKSIYNYDEYLNSLKY